MTNKTDKAVSEQGDLVAQANEEMLALRRQLTDLTEQNTALKQANGDLSHELENAVAAEQATAKQVNGLLDQIKALQGTIAGAAEASEAPTHIEGVPISAEGMPDDVHARLASDPSVVAAAGLTNGEAPHRVRQKLLDAAHRMGAFLEGGIFHNVK